MIEDLSQSRRKLFASLHQAKHRRAAGLFAVEGAKAFGELAGVFSCEAVVATADWIERNSATAPHTYNIYKASRADMERISSLSSAPDIIGIFRIPSTTLPDIESLRNRLIVALDCVQDPGNLGTIIRTCDWYGIDTILCSPDTVDIFNPKVIQSTMGSIGRVNVFYVDLPEILAQFGNEIYGTFLDGDNIYSAPLSDHGIIVMGNEGNGISERTARMINRRLYLPPFPTGAPHVESLNVSIATAITVAEFRRRQSL